MVGGIYAKKMRACLSERETIFKDPVTYLGPAHFSGGAKLSDPWLGSSK